MGLFGSLIGGGISAITGAIGGASTAKKYQQIQQNIDDQQQKNEDWYNRRYNEDATQRADAQAVLTATRDSIREANRSAAGTQAVMGGTEESVAATKAANAKALADAASQINVNADKRKDDIESQYMQTDRDLMQKENDLLEKEAGNTAQIYKGVGDAAQGVGNELHFGKSGKW